VTDDEFLHRRDQQIVSVLFMYPAPRPVETDIRVKIDCVGSGGTARLPHDHWVVVDGLTFLPKSKLMVTSGTEIREIEKKEVRRKLAAYLGLG